MKELDQINQSNQNPGNSNSYNKLHTVSDSIPVIKEMVEQVVHDPFASAFGSLEFWKEKAEAVIADFTNDFSEQPGHLSYDPTLVKSGPQR